MKALDIAKSYFKDKQNKTFKPDSYYINQIEKLGFNRERASEIFLKINDLWTMEEINILNESKAKWMKVGGTTMIILGLSLTISSFYLFSTITLFFYGLILGGILTYFYSRNLTSGVNKNRRISEMQINRFDR